MNKNLTISDIGMEIVNTVITDVRMHRVDHKWLVEYKRIPQYYVDKWWWFNDGTYVNHNEAVTRAKLIAAQGYVQGVRYKKQTFAVKK